MGTVEEFIARDGQDNPKSQSSPNAMEDGGVSEKNLRRLTCYQSALVGLSFCQATAAGSRGIFFR
jgi:hypothetical protein